MRSQINQLLEKIHSLETELEEELAERRRSYGYKLEQGRLFISREARERQTALKLGLRRYLVDSGVLTILTAPFIYAVAIPVFLLDVVASLYQAVCFRVYGVKQVKRRDYVVFDRHRLPYLNVIQKVNCFYCSYANGVIAYVYEIASRTEQYWCPIKHAARLQGTHRRYGDFLEYGDVADYPNSLEAQRTRLRDEGDLPPGPQNPPE
ncbi:hypothetical protein [uncultured Maricaulis sp.]|uniref:hypothetical protein n=1 Tax=uncultured Maricaulis sp. TaxID=174710 RepID=UPI0030D715D9|tara:strand:- start:53233 stop:53853 length:621 start_codon:yes stop_codon:yes gene_type:complete